MMHKLSYTKRIRWRIRLMWLALAAMLVFMVVAGEVGLRDSRVITGFAYGCSNLMFWGGLFFLIARIIANRRLLRDRLRLKERQLNEQDERNRFLHQASGGIAMDATLLLAYVGAVIASCISPDAFYAAFGLLICAACIKAVLWLACARGWLPTGH